MQNIKLMITTIFFILSSHAYAAECFQTDVNNIELKWTAFKTMSKAGVTGTFKKIRLVGPLTGKSIEKVVESTSFDIDAKSVFSNKPERDVKLKSFIFNKVLGKNIKGNFIKMSKGKLITKITLNGVTKDVPLSYKVNKNTLSATGHIDMFDFSMQSQVGAINKACYALHEGKTWSDVSLKVLAKFYPCKK